MNREKEFDSGDEEEDQDSIPYQNNCSEDFLQEESISALFSPSTHQ
jgi:hypothetical protein